MPALNITASRSVTAATSASGCAVGCLDVGRCALGLFDVRGFDVRSFDVRGFAMPDCDMPDCDSRGSFPDLTAAPAIPQAVRPSTRPP